MQTFDTITKWLYIRLKQNHAPFHYLVSSFEKKKPSFVKKNYIIYYTGTENSILHFNYLALNFEPSFLILFLYILCLNLYIFFILTIFLKMKKKELAGTGY